MSAVPNEIMCELCECELSKFLFGGNRVGSKCAAIVMKADKALPSVFRIGGFEAATILKALENEIKRAGDIVLTTKDQFSADEYEHALTLVVRLRDGITEKLF